MHYEMNVIADNLSCKVMMALSNGPNGFDSSYMAAILPAFGGYFSQEIIDKYQLEDLNFCTQPEIALDAAELDRWDSSGRDPHSAPSLWQGTLWRHPAVAAAAINRVADRVEAEDADFDVFVDAIFWAEDRDTPITDQEMISLRPVVVGHLRKFALFCKILVERGTTKIVAFHYF